MDMPRAAAARAGSADCDARATRASDETAVSIIDELR